MCRYCQVSRQSYYKLYRQQEQEVAKQAIIVQQVQQIRREQLRLGTRKIYHELQPQLRQMGIRLGRDKFFELLRCHDLLVKRRRKYAVTTNSDHPYRRYGNELEKATITGPGQAWVSDITYLRAGKGFVYLSLVTDRYSRKIVGWHVDVSLGVEATMKSLRQAMAGCKDPRGIIHHSDRGIQYCSYPYTYFLKDKGMIISMGAVGNCYENAVAERVNGILKDEYALDSEFTDLQQAIKATRQAVYLYNYKRPHWSLNFKKPAEVHDNVSITTNL